MRIDLTDDEAEMIAAALRRCDESDALVALADRFTPPERLTAILMPKGAEVDDAGKWTAEDDDGEPIYPRARPGLPSGRLG